MVRNYKMKVDENGHAVRNQLNETWLQNAIDAVRTNQMSQRKAASHYGIARSTLKRYLDGSLIVCKNSIGHPTVLSKEEEEILASAIIAFGDKADIIDIVSTFVKTLTKSFQK